MDCQAKLLSLGVKQNIHYIYPEVENIGLIKQV